MDYSQLIPLFVEGVMTFFSPCVLPIIPLFVSYLTNGATSIDDNGNEKRSYLKFVLLALCFTLGLSVIFILAAFSSNIIAKWLNQYSLVLQYVSSFIIIFFALFYLHVIDIPLLNKTRSINHKINTSKLNYLNAFLMGFFFTFSWTPCIGPMLGFAISSGVSAGAENAFIYVLVYASGFILMFILLALANSLVLKVLSKIKKIIKWITIIAGLIMLAVGCYTFYNAAYKTNVLVNNSNNSIGNTSEESETKSETVNEYNMDTLDFTLLDANGNEVSLSDYKGKKTLVVFFGTWCTYCRQEIPALQEYVNSYDDLNVLLVTHPNSGINDETVEKIEEYISSENITMDYVYDDGGTITMYFTQGSFPSNWFFNSDGTLLGTVSGAITLQQLQSIVTNQME